MNIQNQTSGSAPPKIAVISHAHPSISKGGAEIAAATLFRGLQELKVPAVFIAAVPWAKRGHLKLGAGEHAVFYDPERYEHFYHLASADVPIQLSRVIEQTGAQVLNFHHFLNLGLNSVRAASALPGRCTVMTLHELLSICHHHGQMLKRPGLSLCNAASASSCATCFPEFEWRRFELRYDLFRDVYAGIDTFVSPSVFLSDRTVAWGVPRERMHVVENGLANATPEQCTPSAERRKFVFGYFGQINPFKGVEVILRAAERLGSMVEAEKFEIRLHGNLIGQTDIFREKLERLSNTLPFLKFLGPYENEQVSELMGRCDYVVVPSIWWENSPVVIQEAYAVGRPVICTGIGGMAEKVRDGVSGLHFERGDAESLLQAMLRAADVTTHARLQAGLPRPISAADMAREYLKVFDRIDVLSPGLEAEAVGLNVPKPITQTGAPKQQNVPGEQAAKIRKKAGY
ncbi:glycosyltransferase [Dankookia rubra]|uniref:Glycosyltransferase n=1 Tax=Dankookia rubra TaxID=1442381 RepID=A0A4R5QAC6_9PROT|nr:glycosyltransferase family 4 protein [Dankookia rubra]TDH60004.1 glycosyltransferase [Dankookia rubra]